MSTERPRVIRRGAVVDWVKFDAELARDGSVDPVDKALYAAIASFVDTATRESAESAEVDPNNVPDWVPTRKRLAECIGRSVDTVDRSTKRLEAHGLLRVDRQPDPRNPKRHLPSVYELLDHYRWDERAAQRDAARKAARNSLGGGRTGAATPGRSDAATPRRTGAASPGRTDAAVKDLEEGVEEESGESAPSARSATDVRRTGAGSSARANSGSAATGKKLPLTSEQRAALRVVEAALPRPLLAQLPGQRIPGNNHRAVLAVLDARTPTQIAGRIGRRWVGWGFEPAFYDGLIRNPIGAALALIGPTPYCPDPSCEDGVMVDTSAECRACVERRANRRAAYNRGEDPRRPPGASAPRPECVDCGRPLAGDLPDDGMCRRCRDAPADAITALMARWAAEDAARAEAEALHAEAARRRAQRAAHPQTTDQHGPPPF